MAGKEVDRKRGEIKREGLLYLSLDCTMACLNVGSDMISGCVSEGVSGPDQRLSPGSERSGEPAPV